MNNLYKRPMCSMFCVKFSMSNGKVSGDVSNLFNPMCSFSNKVLSKFIWYTWIITNSKNRNQFQNLPPRKAKNKRTKCTRAVSVTNATNLLTTPACKFKAYKRTAYLKNKTYHWSTPIKIISYQQLVISGSKKIIYLKLSEKQQMNNQATIVLTIHKIKYKYFAIKAKQKKKLWLLMRIWANWKRITKWKIIKNCKTRNSKCLTTNLRKINQSSRF